MNNDNYQADCHFPFYRHFSSPVFRGTEREKEREGATLFLSSHTLAYTQQHTHSDSNTEAVLCVCYTQDRENTTKDLYHASYSHSSGPSPPYTHYHCTKPGRKYHTHTHTRGLQLNTLGRRVLPAQGHNIVLCVERLVGGY